MYLIKEIKNNPINLVFVLIFDILFFFLNFKIFGYFISEIIRKLSRVPIQTVGIAMQSLDTGELSTLRAGLMDIFFSITSLVVFAIFLFILNYAVLKIVIWALTLNQKIDFRIIYKSIFLNIVMIAIFFIPFVFSMIPFIMGVSKHEVDNPINISFIHFIPLIFFLIIAIYFFTLSNFYLAKNVKVRNSIKNAFLNGVGLSKKIILWFLAVVFITMIVFILSKFDFIITIGVLVILSLFYRLRINKIFS